MINTGKPLFTKFNVGGKFVSCNNFVHRKPGLGCSMSLSTILQLYHGGQFYWYPEKTSGLSQVTDKLDHRILYQVGSGGGSMGGGRDGGRGKVTL
jgi:hypothetical protein